MANKYGDHVKELSFMDFGPGSFQQGLKMDKAVHGLDLCIKYGTCEQVGPMVEEINGMHTHDFDQLLLWMSSDPDNMLDLGAEIELPLGPEGERFLFTMPTAVAIPKGYPHFPATIKSMDKRFQYMEISLGPEWKANPVETDKARDTGPTGTFFSKNHKYVMPLLFSLKGPYFYGSGNVKDQDSGGLFSIVWGKDSGLDLYIAYESIRKAPYSFGPRVGDRPHGPHVHPVPEILFFLGADCRDLGFLGGEAEFCLGKEKEVQKITKPSAVVCPAKFPHTPLTITKVDKPFFFLEVFCHPEHV